MFAYIYAVHLPYAPFPALKTYGIRYALPSDIRHSRMSRTLRDAKLDTRSARLRLPARREPYWRSVSEGLAIGYRKGAKGGTWIARHYTPETGRRFNAIGTADDITDPDGVHVLSFSQAQEAARAWFAALARQDRGDTVAGPYAVRDALDDYVADYSRRGGKK